MLSRAVAAALKPVQDEAFVRRLRGRQRLTSSNRARGHWWPMDAELLDPLRTVIDPELGINIVDLGLVYEADRKGGGIYIALTMTTPACPLGEMMIQDIKAVLEVRFPGTPLQVDLVWDPPWTPDLMTEASRRQLGIS
jgi:metal-sulfur cluster biosynthetic enzyme